MTHSKTVTIEQLDNALLTQEKIKQGLSVSDDEHREYVIVCLRYRELREVGK